MLLLFSGLAAASLITFWISTFCGIFVLPYIWKATFIQKQWRDVRKKISIYPLGLKNKSNRKRKGHSIIDVSKFQDIDEYMSSLCRSAKRNLEGIDKNFKNHSILHVAKNEDWTFTLDHLRVIYEHQLRNHKQNKLKVILKTIVRMGGINITSGCVDEYYQINAKNGHKKLIAFSQPVIKGNTYRAMWFYQLSEYKRCSIWFHSLMLAMNHVMKDKRLRYIDMGPSYNENVKNHKAKYGLAHTENWIEICDYSGGIRSLLDK